MTDRPSNIDAAAWSQAIVWSQGVIEKGRAQGLSGDALWDVTPTRREVEAYAYGMIRGRTETPQATGVPLVVAVTMPSIAFVIGMLLGVLG